MSAVFNFQKMRRRRIEQHIPKQALSESFSQCVAIVYRAPDHMWKIVIYQMSVCAFDECFRQTINIVWSAFEIAFEIAIQTYVRNHHAIMNRQTDKHFNSCLIFLFEFFVTFLFRSLNDIHYVFYSEWSQSIYFRTLFSLRIL